MRIGEITVSVLIIGIVLLMIIPVPLGFLDFLLSINISLALLILLLTMFTKEALEFSIFPSVLLITTLYRLGLNISTTRYILTQGKAGEVIKAFGNFVIMGDPFVGFVIFIILVLIQFIVITKGAERVAEVAARFTLDAMPGKQMAIDADLNSGLITEEVARVRRSKIQREADFYGAMDGASKFVKGDAIVGIIVTVVNIAAGLFVGMLRMGMGFGEAISTFTLLTVGDGLVSQIPALMISTATAIVVTRAASESNLGNDLLKQLFQEPKTMFILSGVLFGLGLTPLPGFPLMSLAAVFLYIGFTLRRTVTKAMEEEDIEEEATEADQIRQPENVIPLLDIDPIELEFGYGIIPLADPNQGGDLFDRLVMIRRQIALEFGMIVPMIRLRDNIQLDANQYVIKIKGNEVAHGEIMFNHYLAMNPGSVEGEVEGIDTVEPAFGIPAKWISESEREKAEIFGYTVVDPSSIISTHLTEVVKKYAFELLGRQDVSKLIENVRENNSTVVEELIPGLMSIGDIQKVLGNLLKEGISIRNLASILEALADNASVTRDVNILTEYVRQSLSRTISSQFIPEKRCKVVTIEQMLEGTLMESIQQSDNGSYLSLDPNVSQQMMNSLAVQIQNLVAMGEQPIVLTAPIVRFYFKRLTEQLIPDLIVLSYNEIESDIEVQSIGMVSV